MKSKLVFGLLLIASFVMVSNLHSSSRDYTPTGFCRMYLLPDFALRLQMGLLVMAYSPIVLIWNSI